MEISLDYSSGSSVITGALIREREAGDSGRDMMTEVVWSEEREGTVQPLEAGKGKDTDSPPVPAKGRWPCPPVSHFWSLDCKIINLCCFKPPSWW